MRSNTRTRAYAAARALPWYPWTPVAVGGAPTMAGLALAAAGVTDALWAAPGGLALIGASTAWWWTREVARPGTTRRITERTRRHCDHADGVATRLDIAEHAGPAALRRRATVLRPSLAKLSRWQLATLDVRQIGVEVATLGQGGPGTSLWSSCEDHTARVGGPRTGKTVSLICHGLDVPGALITTSTKLDIAEGVHTARSAHGAVRIFNPASYGGAASSARWRVLSGCEDLATACRRAGDLIPTSTGEAERWDAKARQLLGLLMYAAATSGRTMTDVRRWAADPNQHDREVRSALRTAVAGADARLTEWDDFLNTNDRTRTSITNSMGAAVAWTTLDTARTLGDPKPDDPWLLDIPRLIEHGETLHLVAGETDSGRIAPLLAALVGEIAHTARLLASYRPAGRLDPPLTMLLDEAALICPVPLDRWTADMGGRGVSMHIAAQSVAQLRARWGDDGASTILSNVGTLIHYGGSNAAADLADLATLAGDQQGDDEHRRPVITPAQLRAMAPGQALVLRRFLRPVIAWTPACVDRPRWTPVALPKDTPATTPDRVTTGELEAIWDADTVTDRGEA